MRRQPYAADVPSRRFKAKKIHARLSSVRDLTLRADARGWRKANPLWRARGEFYDCRFLAHGELECFVAYASLQSSNPLGSVRELLASDGHFGR